ncbi:MAG: putative porin [Candidatus Omnitrophica bacterium]|nr:putative porin [Candidatus Omnitrophota bacterium]
MFKKLMNAVFTLCFSVLIGFSAWAAEIDVLVDKLVEKGVLTQGEGQQLITEAKEETRRELAQGKNETLPKWLQTTKFSGDMRIRYQGETKTGSKHRDRGRFRLRYGFEMKPNELMKVGFRMATGENKTNGPEQTSTNQSFTNSFQNKNVWVDRAYVEYKPFGNQDLLLLKDMTLIGGKFANPFYTTDLVWDGDINPEGGVVKFTPSFGTAMNPFLTIGFLPIGESSSDSNDPFLFAAQAGLGGTVKNRPYKAAVSYYDYENVKGNAWNAYSANYTPTINNSLDGTLLKYDFNILQVVGEFSPMDLTLFGNSMPLTIQGDYAKNLAPGAIRDDTAWLAGLKLGKAKNKGTWEAFWNYRQIGQDAVLATINDSDFHLGGVAAKGNKFGLTYAIMPNSTIGCAYFMTDPYRSYQTATKKHIDIYQFDWVTKF